MQQEIYKTRMVYGPTIEESIEMLKTTPNLAFYWQRTTIDSLMDGACGFAPVESFSFGGHLTFYLSKNSSYTDLINYQYVSISLCKTILS